MATGPETNPVPRPALTEGAARVGHLDMRAQADIHSARRTDTPPSVSYSGAIAAGSGSVLLHPVRG